MLRFQYPSAYAASVKVSSRSKIRPVHFLLKLLLDEKLQTLSQREIALIVAIQAENESERCYNEVVERILQYRSYGDDQNECMLEIVHKWEVGSMSRKKTKKGKQQVIKYEGNNMSHEQMIEIQAEAYYRALKRIEDEKNKVDKQKLEKKKYKWYENVLFILNVCLWPWKINKRFRVSERIYDSIPVMFVSFVLRLVGGIMWFVGIGSLGIGIYNLIVHSANKGIIGVGSFSLGILLLGSFFILAASAFEKETDSNKIYAYSASVIALVSCIVSIIALLRK